MVSKRKVFLDVKPGTLFRVRATCSFAPDEDCIREDGHIYASNGIIEVKEDSILMLVDAYHPLYTGVRLTELFVVIFHFLSGDRELFLPIKVDISGLDSNLLLESAILDYLGIFMENISNSVQQLPNL